MKKIFNRKNLLIIFPVLIIFLTIIGVSYSYYLADLTYVNKTDTKLKADALGLNFIGVSEVNCSNIVPGDKCIKTFDVESASNIATYYNIYMRDVTNEFNEDLVYTLEEDGNEIVGETPTPHSTAKYYAKIDVSIQPHQTKHYKLTIEFKYKANESQNAYQGAQFSANIGIDTDYVVDRLSDDAYEDKLCRRAKTFHTEICDSQNSIGSDSCVGYLDRDGYYDRGATITYGNQTTTDGELHTGDAFDCDVNGDGIYDATTERFYYLSYPNNGITTDQNYAVLIYYSDVINGNPALVFDAEDGVLPWIAEADYIADGGTHEDFVNHAVTNEYVNGKNDRGPLTLIKNLPTINQWKNVRLKSTTRDLTYDDNTLALSNFQYKKDGVDLASRLATLQEILVGTNTEFMESDFNAVFGSLKHYNFLFERTRYSYGRFGFSTGNGTYSKSYPDWQTETIDSRYSAECIGINAQAVSTYRQHVVNGAGARPVIEVPLTSISY